MTTTDVGYWEFEFARDVKAGDVVCYDDEAGQPDTSNAVPVTDVLVEASYVRIDVVRDGLKGSWWVPGDERIYVGRPASASVLAPIGVRS